MDEQPPADDVRPRTVGVEEEFLLVAADGSGLVAAGDPVASAATQRLQAGSGPSAATESGGLEHELMREQVELGTAICASMDEVGTGVRDLRRRLARAAADRGAVLVASATSPFPGRPHRTDDARYARMADQFALVAWQQLTCGMHVHVAVDSRVEGVAVLDRIAPWLPTLRALSTNSPFWQGADTGYASYRTVLWNQWPTAGPVGAFGDLAGYERAGADLIASGAALDDGMIYFDARLSASYPTVETRVADVCLDAEDAVLIAALARLLVEAAAVRWRAGEPHPPVRAELLRAAVWRAGRFSMDDVLLDPVTATLSPAWELVGALLDWVAVAPSWATDRALVEAGLERLRIHGTGAHQQRAVWRGGPKSHDSGDLGALVDLGDLVAELARRTIA
ncbi:MAG: carboxylate-amine ligase [Janthinobacterium lividum]